ncbi:MAG: methylmalonyl Co-A mutase-associated GTPase MeaB [candidate division Zixibacteria bacterium]|nr:methylmalonyl Co-A mutase-associated GTPase MeaB [candidate division Zixibacteria bacterium]
MTVLDRFFEKDRAALSRIISFIENREDGYLRLLSRLYPNCGKGYKIGITGPPGAGKSTLVDKLASYYLEEGHSVGIIAVDPTSPFTGGALLGDRIRMQELSGKGEVFIRSMATRGSGGGLAAATREVSMVMDAFGCDIVIIETVGVGQVELDIAEVCNTTVVVLVPESGDGVQTLKAGLMEIANIFAVNKADRQGSGRLVSEIRHMLDTRQKRDDWNLPVVKTEAVNNVGIEGLKGKIDLHREFLLSQKSAEERLMERARYELNMITRNRIIDTVVPELLDEQTVNYYARIISEGEVDPYSVAEELVSGIDIKKKVKV